MIGRPVFLDTTPIVGFKSFTYVRGKWDGVGENSL